MKKKKEAHERDADFTRPLCGTFRAFPHCASLIATSSCVRLFFCIIPQLRVFCFVLYLRVCGCVCGCVFVSPLFPSGKCLPLVGLIFIRFGEWKIPFCRFIWMRNFHSLSMLSVFFFFFFSPPVRFHYMRNVIVFIPAEYNEKFIISLMPSYYYYVFIFD